MKLGTVTDREGRTLVPLHDHEMGALIRVSDGKLVPCAFGTGGAALIAAEARWALPILAEWRGIAFNDGAGI
jgi:hypothetical protein